MERDFRSRGRWRQSEVRNKTDEILPLGDGPVYDLVIRDGLVFDGLGGEPTIQDVAIQGDRVVAVGQVTAAGREEIIATNRIVTPGFVDIHTHYDGQVTWEDTLSPSSGHGVTTVVMGNCGVGFGLVTVLRRSPISLCHLGFKRERADAAQI